MQFSTLLIATIAFTSSAMGAAVGVCPPWREDRHTLLKDNNDCSIFWKCGPRGPVKIHCPKGLHYAPHHQWCDFPERAYCQRR
ncbi:putative chitin binding protein [Pyronema domesticum]|uniref:Similar to Peritrophin-1 acc. no. O76217 n=1 Tax=Pyronema omphalodes (strain CBS 100304) TaxID=1076935 RepID=U4LF18_PYROM|nr:putative chitin binding protein [Pyronema domesticum]CCX13541.1 Similar to Peritrophin-1; acc. no. O76217 [Pyronema omphalodes CBS 100304]